MRTDICNFRPPADQRYLWGARGSNILPQLPVVALLGEPREANNFSNWDLPTLITLLPELERQWDCEPSQIMILRPVGVAQKLIA